MKKLVSFVLSLLCLISLVSCSSSSPRPAAGGLHTENGDVYPVSFLTLEGWEVEFDEFRYYYLNYKDMYLEKDASYFENEENEKKLKEETLHVLLDSLAVRLLAEEEGVKLTRSDRKDVQSSIDKTIDFYEGEGTFQESLDASYMTEDLYRYMMENAALSSKLFHHLFGEGGKYAWSNEAYYAYFKENYVAVQEIFLPYEEGENATSCPLTTAKAEEISRKATAGEDFWTLVENYGQDSQMLSFPDGYYFTRGQAEEVLYQASAALKEGEISEPVAGAGGVYLIKRVEMKKERMDENREYALFGYTDSWDEYHAGAYEDEFASLYQSRGEKIRVAYGDAWNDISTKSVY